MVTEKRLNAVRKIPELLRRIGTPETYNTLLVECLEYLAKQDFAGLATRLDAFAPDNSLCNEITDALWEG